MTLRLVPQPLGPHGGRSGCRIDLSASLNPLGPSRAALEASRSCEVDRYPDPRAGPLVEAVAERHGVSEDRVVPLPGAAAGIWLCFLALAGQGDTALVVAPCFGEYERCARMVGADSRRVWSWPPGSWPPPALRTALEQRPRVCVLANPSNPGGSAVPSWQLSALCGEHAATTFLVDEAFASFAPAGTSLLDGDLPDNVLVLRSLTKELGLPGLRMGYLVAGPRPASALRALLPAWPISAPSLAAAVAGLGDLEHVRRGAEAARTTLGRLRRTLEAAGVPTFPSDANFLVAESPVLPAALAIRGISVRDCTDFGLPGHFRAAAPRPPDLEQVLAAVAEAGGG